MKPEKEEICQEKKTKIKLNGYRNGLFYEMLMNLKLLSQKILAT